MNSIVGETNIETNINFLNELLYSGGMAGMLDTVWLVICAMVFGGAMDGIGALKKISSTLLDFAKSTFSLFANTVFLVQFLHSICVSIYSAKHVHGWIDEIIYVVLLR